MDKVKIYTEGTPNPNALKFVLDRNILEKDSLNFSNEKQAVNSPLAMRLFEVGSVVEVFVGKNFITVSKNSTSSWDDMYDSLVKKINEHFDSGEPIILTENNIPEKINFTRSEVEEKIIEILDSEIRPAVNGDGGDVIFDSYENGVLKLHLQGSCSSCPSSIMTLKSGIEAMLKKYIPELKEVISV